MPDKISAVLYPPDPEKGVQNWARSNIGGTASNQNKFNKYLPLIIENPIPDKMSAVESPPDAPKHGSLIETTLAKQGEKKCLKY